jgi:general secretion pathway protein G
MSQSMAMFLDKYGVYPPSRLVLCENGNYSPLNLSAVPGGAALGQRSFTYLRKMFPRMALSTAVPVSPPGLFYDFNGNGILDKNPVVITGDECLVFFLGGVKVTTTVGLGVQGFATNPANPFFPNGPNRTRGFFDFVDARLVDTDNDGFPEYADPIGHHVDDLPYAYFSSYEGMGYDPDDVNRAETDDSGVGLIGGFQVANDPTASNVPGDAGIAASPAPNPYTSGIPLPVTPSGAYAKGKVAAFTWIKSKTFQVISPGYDRKYGIGGSVSNGELQFAPTANATVTGVTINDRRLEEDNLTNFSFGGVGR